MSTRGVVTRLCERACEYHIPAMTIQPQLKNNSNPPTTNAIKEENKMKRDLPVCAEEEVTTLILERLFRLKRREKSLFSVHRLQ